MQGSPCEADDHTVAQRNPYFPNRRFTALYTTFMPIVSKLPYPMNPISLENPFQYYSPVYYLVWQSDFFAGSFLVKNSPSSPPHSTQKYLILYAVSKNHGHILRTKRTDTNYPRNVLYCIFHSMLQSSNFLHASETQHYGKEDDSWNFETSEILHKTHPGSKWQFT